MHPKTETKMVGNIEVDLTFNPDNGKWAVGAPNWCTGYFYTYKEAKAEFDFLDTPRKVNDAIGAAYDDIWESNYC